MTERARLLAEGELVVEGRLVAASNTTLLCRIAGPDGDARCVYKPAAGERPLWDFPDGTLAAREYAAYLVSEAAGWRLVPPTVLRDGPYGPGMCQLWVDDSGQELVDVVPRDSVRDGWLAVLDAVDGDGKPVTLVHADDRRLRRLALFDVVINNADRKAGHILLDPRGAVQGVDHGVSFHAEDKLRTVLWGWAGTELTDDERDLLAQLRAETNGALGSQLARLLAAAELTAMLDRIDRLVEHGRLPAMDGRRRPIPWPVF
ncbi:MAG TPA: SCO1664 family protein [Jiangellales bacterium]|nr:SCO1664 family protein [Jiangellales bacterium]